MKPRISQFTVLLILLTFPYLSSGAHRKTQENKFLSFLELQNEEAPKALGSTEVCVSTKRKGRQRDFCEEKYLDQDGERSVVACFANFCPICCGEDEKECISKCLSSHVDPDSGIKDPEEIFMNVCSSERLIETMHPFCEKFYSTNKNSYKMCQSSFCYDCCISELKVNDQKDIEIQKCAGKCLAAIRKLDGESGRGEAKQKKGISASSSLTPSEPEPSEDDLDEEETLDKKRSKIQSKQVKKVKNVRDLDSESEEEPEEEKPKAKRVKASDLKCHGRDIKTMSSQFCATRFDPNSEDYRFQSIDTCKSYFCPLCCSDALSSGTEILSCQKECHNDMMSILTQDTTKPEAKVVPENAKSIKNNPPRLPDINPEAPELTKDPEKIKNPLEELDGDEESFLATVCQSFKTHKCFEEICELGCRENFNNNTLEHCTDQCKNTMKDASFNPTAVKILKYFIQKITNPNGEPGILSYHFKNVGNLDETGLSSDKTIDQQMDEVQSEIKKQKTTLLELQGHLLALQKLKNQQYEKN